ncbi:hypothetical protein LTR12_012367 [Friedmanniomyces endolithicus]|nr:hypothetical protein LTR74_006261 [Friedmanniomyces endolithicus]KAK1813236.1 hypothetical protein LTR12_012367 [Friedmanniomyces endolithicus]
MLGTARRGCYADERSLPDPLATSALIRQWIIQPQPCSPGTPSQCSPRRSASYSTGNGSKAGNASAASMRPSADAREEALGQKGNGKTERRLRAMTKAHHTIISQEVRALNRDVSSAGPSRPQKNSAAFTDGPSGTGELATPGRMGENTSVGREGPYNQSAGGTGAKELSQDGAAVLSEPASRTEMAAASTPTTSQSQRVETSVKPTASSRKGTRIQPPGAPYHPIQPTMADLTTSGSNSSTIAAHNFAGVLADRLTTVTEPGQTPGARDRDIVSLASKLIDGQITRLQSQKEQVAVRAEVEEIIGYYVDMKPQEIAKRKEWRARNDAEGAGQKSGHAYFQPLPEQVRKSLVDKMVKGVYDDRHVLPGDMNKQQPVLNTIAQATMMNSTYLHGDGERLLQKVRSLLPTPASQKKTAAAAGGAAPKKALK